MKASYPDELKSSRAESCTRGVTLPPVPELLVAVSQERVLYGMMHAFADTGCDFLEVRMAALTRGTACGAPLKASPSMLGR